MKSVVGRLAVGLGLCLLPGSMTAQSPPTRVSAGVGGDSVLVRTVMDGVLGTLGSAFARAATDTTARAWQIQFPASDSLLWAPYRDFLWRTLHARHPTAQDSVVRTISIAMPQIRNDTLTVDVTSGIRWRCGPKWLGSSTKFQVYAVRREAAWEGPRTAAVEFSDSGPCGS